MKSLVLQVFINNEWHNSVSGKTFPVYNPSTGEAIANVQAAEKVISKKKYQLSYKVFIGNYC